jgi:prefoldin subunit 5
MGLILDAFILKNLRQINEGVKLVTDATSRIEAAIAGIQGDIDGLKSAAASLQDALDQALANQPQDVQDQINAVVQAARAEFDEQLDELATRLEELDNQTS